MSHESRNSRTFKLNAEQLERAQFEAATEAETAPLDQYQRIESHTPILPKRVKRALVALALIVGAVLVADVVSLVNQLNQLHWFAGLSSGALFGEKAGQAFFVKCDAENNPPESIDEGKLIVEVGIAPVKPAEFVIFRISQLKDSSA